MASFKKYYRRIFDAFGHPLSPKAALPAETLSAAQKRLGVRIPSALRDYYLVAGRERRFGSCNHRLLSPTKWTIDKQRLVFMQENQGLLWWGVSTRNHSSDDPAVFQAINDEPITWSLEHRKCSVFLAVMLHYQAVNGGLRCCSTADAPDDSHYRFAEHGWTYYGEVNSLQAYSRPNQVVCILPPGDLPFTQKWTVLAGAKTNDDLQMIADDLKITFR